MSLYLKDKNDELQNIEKEQKKVKKRKWKEASKYTSRILSAVGVLCVLAVIAGAAAFMPILSKAEGEVDPWDQYAPGTADCTFNQAIGEIDKLRDLKYLDKDYDSEGNPIYIAGIETVDQLKAVLSGLSTADRTDSNTGKVFEVVFRLTKDLTLTDWIAEGSANTFSNAVFDGQGHTITCTYTDSFKNTERRIDSANARGYWHMDCFLARFLMRPYGTFR